MSNFCKYKLCTYRANYNNIGKVVGKYCFKHKEQEMINITAKKCAYTGCTDIAKYNYIGNTKTKYCSEHMEEGMIKILRRTCKYPGCQTSASFNNVGETKRLYCYNHKTPGMISIYKYQKCQYTGCKTHASYNILGESTGIYCNAHKKDGMINVVTKKCEYIGCKKYPQYNLKGEISGRFCTKHKTATMVNVKHKSCTYIGCQKQPNFNKPGKSPGKYCGEHKKIGMVNIYSRCCSHSGCLKQPRFNNVGESIGKFCSDHKKKGMINVTDKTCKYIDCNTIPTYNFLGETRGIYCRNHMTDGMVNVQDKICEHIECAKRATYGHLFHTVLYCAEHRLPNMIQKQKINPKCITDGCKNKAYYCRANTSYPVRCDEHSTKKDINIIEKECSACKFTYFIPNDQTMCNSCRDHQDPIIRWAKELRIKDILDANKIEYISHDNIPELACSRYRPDYVIDNGLFIIIVEVDEKQHKSYAPECEISRMVQLHQDFGGTPVIFIRYNPDNYKNHLGTRVKGYSKNNSREKHLIDLIKRLKNKEDVPPLAAYYLYYDGYDGIPRQIVMDYYHNTIMQLANNVLININGNF